MELSKCSDNVWMNEFKLLIPKTKIQFIFLFDDKHKSASTTTNHVGGTAIAYKYNILQT